MRSSFRFSLLAGAVIFGLSLFGFSGLFGGPEIPWDALARATDLPREGLERMIVRADGFDIRDTEFDFKFVAAPHRIGDPVDFVIAKDGGEMTVREALVRYYADWRLPLVFFVTGLIGSSSVWAFSSAAAKTRRPACSIGCAWPSPRP